MHIPNLSVDKRHAKDTRCSDERCPSKEQCRRFQGFAYENMLTIFYAMPLPKKDGKCNMFIDNTSKEAKEFFPPEQ